MCYRHTSTIGQQYTSFVQQTMRISESLVRANVTHGHLRHRRCGTATIDRKYVSHRLSRCASVVFVVVVLFLPCVSAANRANAPFAQQSYCPSYCTQSNKYNPGFTCTDEYCCGGKNLRYCCDNASLSIGNDYVDVCYACSSTPCGFFGEWSTILMSMAIVLSAGLITACFCHCYASSSCIFGCNCPQLCCLCRRRTAPEPPSEEAPPDNEQSSRRTRRHHRRHGATRRHDGDDQRHGTEVVELPTDLTDFNPTHPFAFRPPDYDELSTTNSEPPKYDEIAMMTSSPRIDTGNDGGGNTNTAFEPEDDHVHQRAVPSSTTEAALHDSMTGSGGVVRVEVRPVDDDPPPPAYEVAVVSSSETAPEAVV